MCQRAHKHRHEGRAIRRQQRQLKQFIRDLPKITEALKDIGNAFMEGFASSIRAVEEAMQGLTEAFFNLFAPPRQKDYIVIQESAPRLPLTPLLALPPGPSSS